MTQRKKLVLPTAFLSIVAMMVMIGTSTAQIAFAEPDATSEPVVKASEELQKNPLAMKILAEMEKQKLRYTQKMQEKTQAVKLTVQQVEVEEKRTIAQQRLDEKLDAFIEKYKDVMPKAAYTKFVEKKPERVQGVFWGMFDYMQSKVDSARAAMKEVLDNGGSLLEARDAYFDHASTKRVQLIQVAEDLNVQHGHADKSVQDTFD
ncbi:MAG: hypothetical protein WD966_04800, partial [Nitrosopumilaceae archaeon]